MDTMLLKTYMTKSKTAENRSWVFFETYKFSMTYFGSISFFIVGERFGNTFL